MKIKVVIKIGLFLLMLVPFFCLFVFSLAVLWQKINPFYVPRTLFQGPVSLIEKTTTASTDLPVTKLKIVVPNGFISLDFMLDPDAHFSSIPTQMSYDLGKDLAFAQRILFTDKGGQEFFAYQDDIAILTKGEQKTLTVVFTDRMGNKPVLAKGSAY